MTKVTIPRIKLETLKIIELPLEMQIPQNTIKIFGEIIEEVGVLI
ncbi:MAG: hypothetical protein ACFFBI_08645 [Promethearchaeota archaeon]